MMNIIILLLLPFFGIISSFEEEKIAWDANRPLTWEDFRGVPNRADSFVASTNSGISFSFSFSERNGVANIQYTVVSNFYPDLSWYRPERVTQYILEHEQTHFDISELHARKLRNALSSLSHDRDFKEKAEAIYNRLEAERRAMQTQYDKESDHSNVKEMEYQWRTKVAQELNALDAWK
ncbi:MAG TPA: DUF922 domain-containing protein [Flavobacteriaceae bacterium]|nr:DUF922 domain-containing protein [Flavobacteriaceae bacterium]HAT64832.1 DUF922 domain-containing protein [Flavobacteriaceae bacterium]|tara:strand:- start:18634 stop:19170 length:537 start_codon:yes stop_codon:yes gene_type:complete